MIWLSDFNHVFFLLFLYLIEANVNHENWIGGFPKFVYYIVGRCVFFLGFFLGKPNKYRFIFNNYSFVPLIIGRFWEINIDRVRKIRLTSPLVRPKKEVIPTKHSGPLAKPQRRDMPIKAFRPFLHQHSSLLVPAQNEGPTRLAQRPIMGSLP